jgi:hypothetical protein
MLSGNEGEAALRPEAAIGPLCGRSPLRYGTRTIIDPESSSADASTSSEHEVMARIGAAEELVEESSFSPNRPVFLRRLVVGSAGGAR